MTRKRRNFLTRWLVSVLALLAIAVPVAQAEPVGLFDEASPTEQPVAYSWLLNQSGEGQSTADLLTRIEVRLAVI